MIEATLYIRTDCQLCDQAKADLEEIKKEIPFQLSVIDVDSQVELQRAFGLEVPVLEIGPYRLKAPITRQEIHMTLLAAHDREQHIEAVENLMASDPTYKAGSWTKADAFSYWFSKHYLAVFNLIVVIYLGLPFLAPVLMKERIEVPADYIYKAYSYVCHQLAFRSFFIFGDQIVYPRAAAGVKGVQSLSQATGLSEDATVDAIIAARVFVGNDKVGYKVALCERDVAIYGGILFFGLLYALIGRRLFPFPWFAWILLGLFPIGMDGVSQLISQPPFDFLPFRESTPYLRVLTGALFGITTAWFGYPIVEETMVDTRKILGDRLLRVRRLKEKGA